MTEQTSYTEADRDRKSGKFLPGNQGGPGRVKGTASPNTVYNARIHEYKAILDARTPEILDIVIDAALAGDLVACRLVLDRVYPAQQAAVMELQGQLDALREQLDLFQASKKSH